MKRLTVRIPDSLFRRINRIARRENRSFNSQLVYILEAYDKRGYGLEKLREELAEMVSWDEKHYVEEEE